MTKCRLLSALMALVVLAVTVSAAGCKAKVTVPKELVISYSLAIQNLDPPLVNRAPDYNFVMNLCSAPSCLDTRL